MSSTHIQQSKQRLQRLGYILSHAHRVSLWSTQTRDLLVLEQNATWSYMVDMVPLMNVPPYWSLTTGIYYGLYQYSHMESTQGIQRS